MAALRQTEAMATFLYLRVSDLALPFSSTKFRTKIILSKMKKQSYCVWSPGT